MYISNTQAIIQVRDKLKTTNMPNKLSKNYYNNKTKSTINIKKILAIAGLFLIIIIGTVIILISKQQNNNSTTTTNSAELTELGSIENDDNQISEDDTRNKDAKQDKEKTKNTEDTKKDNEKKQTENNETKTKEQVKVPNNKSQNNNTKKTTPIPNCTTDRSYVFPSTSECNMVIERDETKCILLHNVAHKDGAYELKRNSPSVVAYPYFGCHGGGHKSFAIVPLNTGQTDIKVNYRGTDTTIFTVHLTVKPTSVRPVKTLSLTCPKSINQTLYGYQVEMQYTPANANNWGQANVTVKPDGYMTATLDGKKLTIMETEDFSASRKPTPQLTVTERIGNVSASCNIPASN